MSKILGMGRVPISLVLCLAILSMGLVTTGGGAVAEAKMIEKAAGGHVIDVDELAQSSGTSAQDLAELSAGMEDETLYWILAGVGVLVIAGVVIAIWVV